MCALLASNSAQDSTGEKGQISPQGKFLTFGPRACVFHIVNVKWSVIISPEHP